MVKVILFVFLIGVINSLNDNTCEVQNSNNTFRTTLSYYFGIELKPKIKKERKIYPAMTNSTIIEAISKSNYTNIIY